MKLMKDAIFAGVAFLAICGIVAALFSIGWTMNKFFVAGEENWLTLVRDPHHLAFEAITGGVQQLVFGVIGGAVIWPRIKAHIHRDIAHGVDEEEHPK